MTKDLWYFAHPYSCRDSEGKNIHLGEEANFNLCCIRSAQLIKKGYMIYSPIAHTHPIHVREPQFLANNEWELWLQLDELFMKKTEFKGIILAPGWENSTGCKRERKHFEEKGLDILLYDEIMK